ncbi:hypothetical protein MNBD_ALPHA09-2030 [hydrothermal vent metagenome]|uniref:SurA N-terminal domain-containing protein n=1 Tax=hydrothermal vent metagenome TaxID=652676 RepID=A0A3B0SX32_9ZZZZ
MRQNFRRNRLATHGLAATFLWAFLTVGLGPGLAQTKVVATVNDEPISQFDVDQRTKFYTVTGGGKAGKKALRARSLKELVEEALMFQEIRRLAIDIPQAGVTASINTRLKANKRNYAWFKGFLRSRGVRIATLENRIRAQLGWRQVIQRTYSGLIDIGENEITRAIKEIDRKDAQTETIYSLKTITLTMAKNAGDGEIARRMEEAGRIRRAFRDCRTSSLVTGRYRDIKTSDRPRTRAKDLTEPTRSLVQQAKANDMIPPSVTDAGIVLIAVCERKDDGGQREKVQQQLVSQEFGMLADRHLRDLKQDAIVEYR